MNHSVLQLDLKKLSEKVAKAFKKKMSTPYQIVGEGEFEVVATSEKVDRDGEVIKLDGWDFSNYMLNPVVLESHDIGCMPVGAVTDLRVENGKVIVRGVFARTDEGQELRQLYDDGILRTVSVGFIPKQRQGNIITQAELIEISFVSVPSNPEAMSTREAKEIEITEIPTDKENAEVKIEKEEKKEVEESAPEEGHKEINQTPDTGDNKSIRAVLPKSTDSLKPQVKDVEVDVKAGRVLSSKNITAMQETMTEIANCMAGMQKCSDMLKAILDSADAEKEIEEEKLRLKHLRDLDKICEVLIRYSKQSLNPNNK